MLSNVSFISMTIKKVFLTVQFSKFSKKHIGRNPRFDREGHWAEIGNIGQTWNIGQTYGTLGRY